MKSALFVLLAASSLQASLMVSEVERNPAGSETESPGGKSHEYIELVNLSSDTISTAELTIFDGITRDQVVPKSSPLLPPGKVLIILDQEYFPLSEQYPIPIDPSAATASVNHSSICGGLSGTDGFIIEYRGKTAASFTDSLSEEGKLLFCGTEEPEIGTIAPQRFFLSPRWSESPETPGSVRQISGSLFREYLATDSKIEICAKSFDKDGVITVSADGNVLKTFAVTGTVTIDSAELPAELRSLIITGSGGFSFSDTISLTSFRLVPGSVKITEISPRGDSEWLELRSESSENIDLTGWKIAGTGDTCSLPAAVLKPHSYLVLAEKEFPKPILSVTMPLISLDNYRDTIKLISPFGPADSASWDYTVLPKWDTETLHRTASGSLTLAKASPGGESALPEESSPITLTVTPQLFTPDGDGKDDSLQIDLTAPVGWSRTVRIFSSEGIEVRRADVQSPQLFWDGLNSEGSSVRRGPYIIIAEFSNGNGKSVSKRAGAVLWR